VRRSRKSTPGIAADSNGLFHGLGDHAENSFSVDGQPITDQQSKVFSNQIPLDSVQSLEVISGAPPAEYGGKTSVVIVATTRSGQGVTTPHGSVTTSYGSFGSSNLAADLAYGGKNWGNFISASGLNTGRFLDPPEFTVLHDKGNEENLFDRVDYQLSSADSIHLNFGYSRSWFQTPNSLDAENATPWSGLSGIEPQMENFNGSGSERKYRRTNRPTLQDWHVQHCPLVDACVEYPRVFTLGTFVRRDDYNYYPSSDPFADLRTAQSSEAVRGSEPHAHQYGSSIRYFLRKRASTRSRLESLTNKRFSTKTTGSASSIRLTTHPVSPRGYEFSEPVPLCRGLPGSLAIAPVMPRLPAKQRSNLNAPAPLFYPYFNPILAPYDLTRGGSLHFQWPH
jgi:hypothetical protein